MARVRDVKKLIECVNTCLASINKVKTTALYTDNYRVETVNILDEIEDVLVVGIKSFVKPMDEPNFEIKIVIKNVCDRLLENELECQKFIVDYIWKKYKTTKFEMENKALRQGIWNRLNNNTGTYTKLDAEIDNELLKKYTSTDIMLTKQEVDNKVMQNQNQHKIKDTEWQKFIDELWSSD